MAKKTSERTVIVKVEGKAQIDKLKEALTSADQELERLGQELEEAKQKAESFQDKYNNLKFNTGVATLEEELRRFRRSAQQSVEEFQAFLQTANLVDGWGGDDARFSDFFNRIKDGSITASQAITQIKTEMAHLMEENYSNSGGAFDAKVIQGFMASLNKLGDTVDVIYNKIVKLETEGVKAAGGTGAGVTDISGMMDVITQSAERMEHTANGSIESITNLVGALGRYAMLDENKLLAVSQAFRNMADLHSGSFSTKSVDNIVTLAKQLKELNSSGFTNIRFNIGGLKDFKVSKTLPILTEFLNHLRADQVTNLERLQAVDLSNLSNKNFRVDSGSFDNLKLFLEQLKVLQTENPVKDVLNDIRTGVQALNDKPIDLKLNFTKAGAASLADHLQQLQAIMGSKSSEIASQLPNELVKMSDQITSIYNALTARSSEWMGQYERMLRDRTERLHNIASEMVDNLRYGSKGLSLQPGLGKELTDKYFNMEEPLRAELDKLRSTILSTDFDALWKSITGAKSDGDFQRITQNLESVIRDVERYNEIVKSVAPELYGPGTGKSWYYSFDESQQSLQHLNNEFTESDSRLKAFINDANGISGIQSNIQKITQVVEQLNTTIQETFTWFDKGRAKFMGDDELTRYPVALKELFMDVNSSIQLLDRSLREGQAINAYIAKLTELIAKIEYVNAQTKQGSAGNGTVWTERSGLLTDGSTASAEKLAQVEQKEADAFRSVDDAARAHVASEEAAAKAEDDKRKISELLSEALKREEEATRRNSAAADEDAERTRRAAETYQELLRIQNEIGNRKVALAGLNPEKDAQQITALTNSIKTLQNQYDALFQQSGADLFEAQANRLNRGFEQIALRVEEVRGRISDLNSSTADADKLNVALTAVNNTLRSVESEQARMRKITGGADTDYYHSLTELAEQLRGLRDSGSSAAALTSGLKELKLAYAETLEQANLFKIAVSETETAQAGEARESAQHAAALEQLTKLYMQVEQARAKMAGTHSIMEVQEYEALAQRIREVQAADQAETMTAEQLKAVYAQLHQVFTEVNAASQPLIQQSKDRAAAAKEEEKATRDANKASQEKKKEDDQKAALLKRLNRLYEQCTVALQKYAAVSKLAGNREAYEGIKSTAEAVSALTKELNVAKPDLEGIAKRAQEADVKFSTFSTTLRTSGGAMSNWLTTGMSQLQSRLSYTFGLAAMVYKAVGEIKKMVTTAVELDSAMNTLQIVTRASGADMEEYGKRVSSMAKETAQATKDLIDATTVYARLGYSMDESTTLAKYTAMLQNVGGIEASAAQDAMTAIIKAFGKNVNDIEDVMDKLVLVGNRFPISVSQLAEGMNNAGSMLNVAGNSFEQSIALLTAANSTIQNISKASTGLRTIAARIRKTTTGEDGEGEIVEESKYQEMVNALTKKHVDLVDKVTGEYRSTYDIIRDIARVWKDMTSMEQAAVVEALAGTRQQNIFASLMTQFGAAEDAMEQMQNSAGALQQSYDIYLNSIQAHIQTFKAAFDELSKTVVDSKFAKGVIDTGTVIIETIEKLVDTLGVLGTAITSVGSVALLRTLRSGAIVASIKGVGQAIIGVLGTIKAVVPELLLIAGAIAAVTFAVKKYKEAHPTVDDLSAAAETAKTEAEAAKKAYEDTADAIKENKKRIKELQDLATNGEITAAQKTELEKLIEQNTEYERQIELLKRKAELTKEAADDSQREAAHAKLQEYVGDGTKRNVTYFGAGAWDRVGGDAKVVLGGTVPEHNDATYNINAAIQMYAYAQEQLRAIQHEMDRYVDEDTDAAREKASKLLADEAAAKQTVSDTYAQLRAFYIDLANLRDEFSGLTDPQSVDDLRYLDYWLEQLDKAMKKDDAEVEKFKRNLEYLDKTVRDKLTKGLRLNEEEQKRFYDWLNRCGYKAEDFGRILQKMQQDAEGIELPGGEESDEDTFVDHQLVKWGTLADEIETAKAALEEYNKALEGGNNGDTAAAMQDAWQKAMEEIDEGRVDSRAAWALYEMVFSPEQIDAMGRDANQLAQAIGSEFLRGLFDDSNSENGYDDSDSVYGYGQRLIYKLMDNLDQLEGIDIWRDDTGLHYWIDDFKALADQLGISEGLLDAFLDDLDAYGAEMLIDTKQNTALTNSLNDYLNNIDDAREATKKFVEDTLNDPKYKDVDDTTVLRILDSLHAQGDLQLDPAIYRGIVDDVRAAMKQAAEEAAAEDGALKIEAEPDEEYAQNGMITLLGNMQDFLNQEENELKINVGYNIADFPDLSVDYGDSGSGSSSNEGYASASGKKAGKNGGDTLVNELGPELISDNGRAFIANGGKPGFVRLSDDAIVFTANETKDILKGKRNVNAKAYATGNVGRGSLVDRLVHGSVNARAYIRCPVCGTANPDYRASCYNCGASLHGGSVATVNNSIGTTGNANAGVNRSALGSPTAMPYQNMGGTGYDIYGYDSYDQQAYEAYVQAQYYMEEQRLLLEAARKREEEARRRAAIDERNRRIQAMRENQKKNSNKSSFAGTGGGNYVGGADYASAADPQKVDWVAIRINRIQRAIADLEKVASSGFKKLDTRLQAARDQISKTTDEIEIMNRAYDRYIREANSVGLSESIAANVREGTIDISSYDDDTRKKIDEYQEW